MKARVLWLILLLVLGGGIGMLVVRDPGYVLVVYDRLAIETSLWVALVALVLAYALVRLLLVVGSRLLHGRQALAGWNRARRGRQAEMRTMRGLRRLAEGRWGAARRDLVRGAVRSSEPLVNRLFAAQAAQFANDPAGRDALLEAARSDATDAEGQTAVDFTRAVLLRAAGDRIQARQVLDAILAREPGHPGALRMLADCCREDGDWPALTTLLPLLRKGRVLPTDDVAALERVALLGRLGGDPEAAIGVWDKLGRAQRREPELAAVFAGALLAADSAPPNRTGEQPMDADAATGSPASAFPPPGPERTTASAAYAERAEAALRTALQHGWDARLVELYGLVVGGDVAARVRTAAEWAKQHPEDAVLALTRGRLALRNGQWNDAYEHFETSLRLAPGPVARAELARLAAAIGETRAGSLLQGPLPALPAIPLPPEAARPEGRMI